MKNEADVEWFQIILGIIIYCLKKGNLKGSWREPNTHLFVVKERIHNKSHETKKIKETG